MKTEKSNAATTLGYAFGLVVPLMAGIQLGVRADDDKYSGGRRVCAALQNDGMISWVHITCMLADVRIESYDNADHQLWLQGTCIPLTVAEAEAIHAVLQCRREDDAWDIQPSGSEPTA